MEKLTVDKPSAYALCDITKYIIYSIGKHDLIIGDNNNTLSAR